MTSRAGSLALLAGALVWAAVVRGHENHTSTQPPYNGGGSPAGDGSSPLTFDALNVQLLSWIPVTQFNPAFTSASVVEGYVSPAGREYALVGLSGGMGVVEVTDPNNATIVSGPGFNGVVAGPTSLWRDIRTYGHYAYAVSEGGGGIQVFNLSQIDAGIVSLTSTVNDVGPGRTHTVYVNQQSGYLYRCGGGGGALQGLRIYSLANPAAPSYVASWGEGTRYVHECQVVSYTSGPYAGREIAFCYSNNTGGGGAPGVDILDVTNKANIIDLARATYPNSAFSHQGWLSEDQRYIYINDELDGLPLTRIVNVENLAAPFFAGSFNLPGGSIDHNLYCRNGLIYQANYRSGLRVFDAANPLAPVEIAHFDTYTEDDAEEFNSLWDNDPYLPSGIVLGSDIEKGLFVWRVGPPELEITFPGGVPTMLAPGGGQAPVRITPLNGGALEPGSARLHYDLGGGFSAVALTPVAGNDYTAVFPAAACGQVVAFYVTAESTSGFVTRSPMSAPVTSYSAVAAYGATVDFEDDMEIDRGWTAGAAGDNATSGVWVRVDPVGTTAQPEDDHTPAPGVLCWVTGQGLPGGNAGDNDVDGGRTTLLSPLLDLSGLNQPVISYWRWYSNSAGGNPGQDVFTVDISNNGGASWTNVEVVGPTGADVFGGWRYHEFDVAALLPPTGQVRLRFIAADTEGGSLVEAGVDDLQVRQLICTTSRGDVNCDGTRDFFDIDPFLLALFNPAGHAAAYPGCSLLSADLNLDSSVDFFDIDPFLACLFSGVCP